MQRNYCSSFFVLKISINLPKQKRVHGCRVYICYLGNMLLFCRRQKRKRIKVERFKINVYLIYLLYSLATFVDFRCFFLEGKLSLSPFALDQSCFVYFRLFSFILSVHLLSYFLAVIYFIYSFIYLFIYLFIRYFLAFLFEVCDHKMVLSSL